MENRRLVRRVPVKATIRRNFSSHFMCLWCWRVLLVSGLAVFFSSNASALDVFSPIFEKLPLSELRKGFQQNPKSVLHAFFLAERLELGGQIHAAAQARTRAQGLCRSPSLEPPVDSARELACTLVWGTEIPRQTGLSQFQTLQKYRSFRESLSRVGVARMAEFYVDGRVLFGLPPGQGRRPGKSLLAWKMLERLKPAASHLYWQGHIYTQLGHRKLAQAAFDQALAQGDTRAQLRFAEGRRVARRRFVDGESFGWSPALFYSRERGVGASLAYVDDRVGDQPIQLRVNVAASISAYLRGGLNWKASLSPNWFIEGDYQELQARETDFGLGPSLTVRRTRAQVGFGRRLFSHWEFAVGTRYVLGRDLGRESDNGIVNRNVGGRQWARYAQLSYDSRDSRYLTRTGTLLKLDVFFTPGVWEWRPDRTDMVGSTTYSFHRRHSALVDYGFSHLRKDRLQTLNPVVGWDYSIPGMGQLRLPTDTNAYLALGYRYQLGTTLYFGPRIMGVFLDDGEGWRPGVGAFASWLASGNRRTQLGVDVNYLRGHLRIAATGGLRF